jgi:hypothetical protein
MVQTVANHVSVLTDVVKWFHVCKAIAILIHVFCISNAMMENVKIKMVFHWIVRTMILALMIGAIPVLLILKWLVNMTEFHSVVLALRRDLHRNANNSTRWIVVKRAYVAKVVA